MFSFVLLFTIAVVRSQDAQNEDDLADKHRITIDHEYYRMKLFKNNAEGMFDKFHVDMSDSVEHKFLSEHGQAAEAVSPGFKFPFYGHIVDKFFITTHGFLSFAPRLHNLMYKTQYIAPLRVKFDPSQHNTSTINYRSRADSLTIQWTNITVAEPYKHPRGGTFTFQVTLFENGDIAFVYVEVPELLTADALYDNEPVAGLSDAFLIGDSELHVYHTLHVDNPHINTKTVVVFDAKPTCIQQQSCDECVQMRKTSSFQCAWCPAVNRCSDGADRLREHWDLKECPASNTTDALECASGNLEDHHTEWRSSMHDDGNSVALPESEPVYNGDNSEGMSTGSVISIVVSVFLVLVLIGLLLGFVYIYGRRNPGGIAERIAMRLEANYKRFEGDQEGQTSVEDGSRQKPASELKTISENNNSITVSF